MLFIEMIAIYIKNPKLIMKLRGKEDECLKLKAGSKYKVVQI
jgi:hypothetical protein